MNNSDGYSKNATVGDVLENIKKKLNDTEMRVIYGLIGSMGDCKMWEQKILYWRKRYEGSKAKYNKMKAERDYWQNLFQKCYKEELNGKNGT